MGRGLRALAVIAALAIVAFTAYGVGPRDFCTYYTAGLVANEDGAAAAFDLDRLNRRHTELHPDSGRRVGSFYYSPLFLAPASLLARLDFEAAEVVNQVLILLALGGILYFVLEAPRPKWLLALLFLAFVLGDPVRIQFLYQNWTAVFVLLIVLALRNILRGSYASAVLFWAFAMHLKLYAGLFLVPLWFMRHSPSQSAGTGAGRYDDPPSQSAGTEAGRYNDPAPGGESGGPGGARRVVLGVLAVFLLLLALPIPWTGLDAPAAYLGSLADEAGGGLTVFYNQISIPATLARFARTPLDWVTSNRLVESLPLQALVWAALAGFLVAVWKLGKLPAEDKGPTRALALCVPFLLLFVPKMWDHGELLFFALFAVSALSRRLEAFAAAFFVLTFAYFPLVQHLLEQTLRGEVAPIQLQALLFAYPLLNLLAAATLLQGDPADSTP